MKALDAYSIPFVGLADGHHHFEFRVSGKFFEAFDTEEGIEHTEAVFQVTLEKKTTMLELDMEMNGHCPWSCDRCGEEYQLRFSGDEHWVVKFGTEEEDDIIVLSPDEHTLSLGQLFYESIVLNLPVRRIHPEGECDEEALSLLNSSEEGQEEDEERIDPRWDALRALKNDKTKG